MINNNKINKNFDKTMLMWYLESEILQVNNNYKKNIRVPNLELEDIIKRAEYNLNKFNKIKLI